MGLWPTWKIPPIRPHKTRNSDFDWLVWFCRSLWPDRKIWRAQLASTPNSHRASMSSPHFWLSTPTHNAEATQTVCCMQVTSTMSHRELLRALGDALTNQGTVAKDSLQSTEDYWPCFGWSDHLMYRMIVYKDTDFLACFNNYSK